MFKKCNFIMMIAIFVISTVNTFAESLEEESARRLPPVLYELNMPEYFIGGEPVTIEWSILGYHSDYKSTVAFFDCDGVSSCGGNYGTNFESSGYLESDSDEEGTWNYSGNFSRIFHYSYAFDPIHVVEPKEIVIRFYRVNAADYLNGKSGLSLLVPGNISARYYDTSGRRIVRTILPAGNPIMPFCPPCSSCGYSGPYDRGWHGDNTNHLGQDYPAFAGNFVRAIADGKIYQIYSNINGFGGDNPSRPGPAVVIQHKKANGTIFYALYGHCAVLSVLYEGDFVKGNEVIGKVQHYYYGNEDWPHLHFAIWDSPYNFPTSNLGYGSNRNFVDPASFLNAQYSKAWRE